MCLMTAHARPVFHKWIGLQLCHLIGVTAFACAQRRHAREFLRCWLAVADSAFDTVGGMRAGLPLVINRLMAGGTGIPGWNSPMDHMRSIVLLRNGRVDGSSQKEKNEQGGAEQTGAEPIHRKILLSIAPQYGKGNARRSVIPITSCRNAILALAAPEMQAMVCAAFSGRRRRSPATQVDRCGKEGSARCARRIFLNLFRERSYGTIVHLRNRLPVKLAPIRKVAARGL